MRTQVIESQKQALEVANRDLDLKNKEISEQKAILLELHQRHKDADFEIHQFKQFMLDQFRVPLSELKESLEIKDRYNKEAVIRRLDQLMDQVKDWDNLPQMEQLDTGGKSLTILPELFESIIHPFQSAFKAHDIAFYEDFQLTDQWVELDVLKFKLFWQYLFREIMKYQENGSVLKVKARSGDQMLKVEIETHSKGFSQNLDEIKRFSPYFKVSYKLLEELNGTVRFEQQENKVKLNVRVPFELARQESPVMQVRHWKHLDLHEQLDPDKYHIILLGKKYELDSLVKIIHDDQFNIIVEEEVQMVISAIRNAKIDALVIYNEKITQHMADLIEEVKNKNKSRLDIPVIYIYEQMEYGFQEKLMDLGVETFIQLPASSAFILKKIASQLNIRKSYQTEKYLLSLVEDEEEHAYSSPNEKLVKHGMKIIMQHLADPDFRVETLSESLEVSKIKCYRTFKEILGTAPSDLIISLRLQKAERLLQKKRMNVSEVSFECGFNDPKYFSKLFKKHFGVSPKSYVHSH